MSPIDERLKSLNIVLPDVMPPVVDGYVPAFAPFTRSGDQIHLSGRLGIVIRLSDGWPFCVIIGSTDRHAIHRHLLPTDRVETIFGTRNYEQRDRTTSNASAMTG